MKVFKIISRWYKNLKWLFNSPPTALTGGCTESCNYCGTSNSGSGLWQTSEYTICDVCRKKVFDAILKNDK